MVAVKVTALLFMAGFALASSLRIQDIPHPSDLALLLGEEEFEDYLDYYLGLQAKERANATAERNAFSGCTIRVNGDLGQPQPVYLSGGKYLEPYGNTGTIRLSVNQEVNLHCTGSGRLLQHPNSHQSNINSAVVRCSGDTSVTGSWLHGQSYFGDMKCSNHAFHDAWKTSRRCAGNRAVVIEVGFIVDNRNYPLMESCFDESTLEVLYVKYRQTPESSVHQSGVDRPSFLAGSFFPGVDVNAQYTQVSQKQYIANVVGASLADKYVTSSQFLARGHLAAKSDYVYATGQRATFYFINAAPQWQPFNAGNWNFLEQNLRQRIGNAGYYTTIYTGTWGVTQLRDANNVLRDIYLYTDNNNNKQIPVPLYFYKVAYDELSRRGVAFVSINNPYYTLDEIRRNLVFCNDRCRGNNNYNWIGWRPDDISTGYSFCCEIDDFRRTVNHLPSFVTTGLLF